MGMFVIEKTPLSGEEAKTDLCGGVPTVAQSVKNLTSSHENVSSFCGLPQWVKDPLLP